MKKEMSPSVNKYFKNYALELYGASILEQEQEDKLSIKTVLDRVCDEKLKEMQIETKYKGVFDKQSRKLEIRLAETFGEQIKEEIEQLELQFNSLKCQIKTNKQKKANEDASKEDLESKQQEMIKQLEQMIMIQEQNTLNIEEKANIKDLSALMEVKANSNDVYKVVDEMQKTINSLSQRNQSE